MKVGQISALHRPEQVHSIPIHHQQQNIKQNIVYEDVVVVAVESSAGFFQVDVGVGRNDFGCVETGV